MHQSILVYRSFRYLKWAAGLTLIAVIAYAAHQPLVAPNGGTWLGYTLGTIGALMILWLMWFGIRKRSYASGTVKLEDWLSAHVYLGLALIIVATLHTGFQFGWNVHTLAYGLMLFVIVSGIFGVFAYMRYPKLMTENRRGQTLRELMATIAEIDAECREVAMKLGDRVNQAVLDSVSGTRIGGSVWRQLSGEEPNCATARALTVVRSEARADTSESVRDEARLIGLLGRKAELLRRARKDVQFKAMMDIWLYAHVPLSFALLAALTTHVVSVFFYW
jgi:hypothetical protein